jgi:hypothetical protein
MRAAKLKLLPLATYEIDLDRAIGWPRRIVGVGEGNIRSGVTEVM